MREHRHARGAVVVPARSLGFIPQLDLARDHDLDPIPIQTELDPCAPASVIATQSLRLSACSAVRAASLATPGSVRLLQCPRSSRVSRGARAYGVRVLGFSNIRSVPQVQPRQSRRQGLQCSGTGFSGVGQHLQSSRVSRGAGPNDVQVLGFSDMRSVFQVQLRQPRR